MKTLLILVVLVAAIIGVFVLKPKETQAPIGPVPVQEFPAYYTEVRGINISTDDIITSPLVLVGEAKGIWYFEASFPVSIYDANGQLLGQAPAQAQGEWMTEDYVQFRATVPFKAPTTETGYVLIQNDNPSGMEENQKTIRINIRFK